MVRNAGSVPSKQFPGGDGKADGLSPFPNALRSGMNSGYQALGMAIAAGARTVVLCGYDLQFTGGRSHWHKGHPERLTDDHEYRTTFARYFEQLQLPPGVEVLNASPGSVLRKFKMVNIEEVF